MRLKQRSIRKFLLNSMFLSALIAGVMTVLASYYLNLKDLRPYLDAHLVIENEAITEIIKQQKQSQYKNIAQHFETHSRHTQLEYDYSNSDLVHQIINSTFFQIQTIDGSIIYQNYTAPSTALTSFKPGFSYQATHEKLYRVYSTQHPDLNVIVSTVQPHQVRQKLENDMVIKFVSIFLIIYLILSITISIILRRALLLIDTAHELLDEKKSDPQSDITKKDLPIELQPFFESLNSMVSKLDQSLQREKRFAYDAAHELKTPLAALQTHLQIAQITHDTAKRKESLEKARQCINRSCHTIDQLLELVKTIPKRSSTELETIDITPVLGDIQSDNGMIILEETGPLLALADTSSLMIVLKIFTENAVKFGATELNIVTTETEHFITLTCSDNGPGVPKEYLNRLGERFFRVYGTNVDGSGIGLNIASEIIHQMNGTLYFSENVPTGLSVHIGLRKPPQKQPR